MILYYINLEQSILGQFFDRWDLHVNGNVASIREDLQGVMARVHAELVIYRNHPNRIDIEVVDGDGEEDHGPIENEQE